MRTKEQIKSGIDCFSYTPAIHVGIELITDIRDCLAVIALAQKFERGAPGFIADFAGRAAKALGNPSEQSAPTTEEK